MVWVKGDPSMERVAEKVINMIEEQAHTSGLTDRVRNMLYKLLGKENPEEALESEKPEKALEPENPEKEKEPFDEEDEEENGEDLIQ